MPEQMHAANVLEYVHTEMYKHIFFSQFQPAVGAKTTFFSSQNSTYEERVNPKTSASCFAVFFFMGQNWAFAKQSCPPRDGGLCNDYEIIILSPQCSSLGVTAG